MSELSHLCRGEGYRACDDVRKYQSPPSRRSDAL